MSEQFKEILREASLALGGRTVTLWEATAEGLVQPRLSVNGEVDAKELLRVLTDWHVTIKAGDRWVSCASGGNRPWVVAPVRTEAPAPPPEGKERRGEERMALEIAGLCLGLAIHQQEGMEQHHKVQQLLTASEEWAKMVTEAASDAIITIDSKSRIRFANPATERLFGWPLHELIGRSLTELMPDRLGPRHTSAFSRYLETGRKHMSWLAAPLTGRRKDGRSVPIEVSISEHVTEGERLFTGVVRDVTARRRAEHVQTALYHISEAASQAASLQDLLAAIHRIVGELMPARNFYIAFYDAESDLLTFPYHVDEMDPAPPARHPGKGLTEYVLRTGAPLLGTRETLAELERRDLAHPGGTRCVDWLGVPLIAGGRTTGVLVAQTYIEGERYGEAELTILRFVSVQIAMAIERKRTEEARRQAAAELAQAQRMEEVGRLAGGIAHDFNNLLTAILSYVDFVLLGLGADHPVREDVEQVRLAALKAAGLTRQLLAFSRRQVLQPRVLDLNTIVREMERLLKRLIGEHITLETSLARKLGSVRADPSQLEQVIVNLCVNARDAMPNGGRITIETAEVDAAEVRAHGKVNVQPGAYVMLRIRDSGVGMDTETQRRLFEPFFTTKERGQGTGLGLATIYGIVKQSGGYIWVDSEPGHGATFTVHLPVVAAAAAAPSHAGALRESLRGSEVVLLVEDDAAVRDLGKRTLTDHGYTVLEAGNGVEALKVAQRHQGTIDLLLADVVMPQMGGRPLAEALGASRPDMALLFVSGYTEDSVIQHGVQESGIPFLQKPFTPAALLGKVRDVLDERA